MVFEEGLICEEKFRLEVTEPAMQTVLQDAELCANSSSAASVVFNLAARVGAVELRGIALAAQRRK